MFACAPGALLCWRVRKMSFAAAVKHKLVVCEIAAGAAAEGKSALLGVIYDELARQV